MVSSEDEQRGLELGAVDYITKPITPAIVLARVRTQLEARQARDLLKKLNLQLVHQVAQGVHALELAQQQLLQSEKMAAIGQLAAGVAHEINNPLGYVSSNLGTLRQYLTGLLQLVDAYRLVTLRCAPDDSALLEANRLAGEFDLEYVRDDAPVLLAESTCGLDRIRRIVSDLKDFSHVDAVVWEPFDLHACLESTLNVVWNELKYKVTLVKEYGDLPAITGLPHQLSQVFMNLLINAAQAIVEHGTITLRTGCAADSVWIEVEDSGVGIAPENLPRIFEPFFTTKPVGSGTGLGMAVSYSIVQKHQGSIDIRSEVGQGTTVRVNLPIHPAGVDSQAGLPA
jgi:signal transduction histidine kinase